MMMIDFGWYVVRYMILTQAQGEQFSLILLTVLKVVSVSAIYVYIQKVFLFSFVSVVGRVDHGVALDEVG